MPWRAPNPFKNNWLQKSLMQFIHHTECELKKSYRTTTTAALNFFDLPSCLFMDGPFFMYQKLFQVDFEINLKKNL